ncbi:hypothetical protein ACN47E_000799 [Coniothyrium glycines]
MARTRKVPTAKHAVTLPQSDSKKAPSKTAKGSKRKRESLQLNWDDGFAGFTILPPTRANKKQKTDEATNTKDDNRVITDPFPETTLGQPLYQIEPAKHWESAQRYRRFTLQGDVISVGQMVYVENPEEQQKNVQVTKWLAKILEIRAADPSHVYLRIYWAYRPEDLDAQDGGRQPYHGTNELIVSNHMDVIEALTVLDVAEVAYWNDTPDKHSKPKPDELFWRQSLDVTVKDRKKRLSTLNTYCIDNAPSNADEPLIQCPVCSIYLHASCLEQDAVLTAFEAQKSQTQSGGRAKKLKKAGQKNDPAYRAFSAELSSTSANLRLTVQDKRKGKNNLQQDVDITCLKCRGLIQAARGDGPKTPAAQMDNEDEEEEEDEEDIEPSITVSPDNRIQMAMSVEKTLTINPLNLTQKPDPDAEDSTDAAKQPKKRGRGRPPRKKRGRGAAKKPKTPVTEVEIDAPVVMQLGEQGTKVTPPPLPVNESILQSGIRSVKRLLFR